ncbi:MAG: hypothetical protein M3Y57_04655, partial [Acidobacteriota bacterium]|nr:hypothetical protein [Acidobacteriota bacterium]
SNLAVIRWVEVQQRKCFDLGVSIEHVPLHGFNACLGSGQSTVCIEFYPIALAIDVGCKQMECLSCANARIEYTERLRAMDETPQAATFLDREWKITELEPARISHR